MQTTLPSSSPRRNACPASLRLVAPLHPQRLATPQVCELRFDELTGAELDGFFGAFFADTVFEGLAS